MSDDKTQKLMAIVRKLEDAAEKILATQGYVADAAKSRLLAEMVKEQISNENSGHTTRAVR